MKTSQESTPQEIVAKIREVSPEDADVAQEIFDWSRQHFKIRTTPEGWNIAPEFQLAARTFRPFVIQERNSRALYVDVQNIRSTPPFDTSESWQELRKRLVNMPGVHFEPTPDHDYYKAEYSDLANDDAMKAFQETIVWSIEQVKSAQN
jgi:hypothetical protein